MSYIGESCSVCGALYGDGVGWVMDRNDRGEIEHTCPECWERAWINQSCDVCGLPTDDEGAGWITLGTGDDPLDREHHYCPVCAELVCPELFYIQWIRADLRARGNPERWSTWMAPYEDRADAEASMALLRRHPRVLLIEEVSSAPIVRIKRWFRARALPRLGRADRWAEFRGSQNFRGEEFDVIGDAEVIYRVVSTSELRAEGEDVLRAAKEQAFAAVGPRGSRIRDASEDEEFDA